MNQIQDIEIDNQEFIETHFKSLNVADVPPTKRQFRFYLKDPSNLYFTEQEYEIIPHLLNGYKEKEIAAIMNLSPRTIGFYIEVMRKRCQVDNKNSLIHLLRFLFDRLIKTDTGWL